MDSEDEIKENFHTADFIAFGATLAISAVIGVYFAYKDRKNTSMDNYFFGGKAMHPITVGLSLVVTFQSSIAIIAEPAEAYFSGNVVIWGPIMNLLAVALAFFYFIPAFHRLQLRTVYEYLELRFNKPLRRLAAVMLTIGAIFYMGIVVYVPASALNAVTPLPLSWSIILTAMICTLYTAVGGMKAVIWTDALQSVLMIVGIISIFIQGLIFIGGFGNLFDALERGERYTAGRFDYGLISRISPIGVILGGVVGSLNVMAFSQQIIQRYQSCRTTRQAQCAVLVYLFPTLIIAFTIIGNGLMMYAYFEGCDPVKTGKISGIDQGIPYMTLKLFADVPGMAGMFVAAVYSGALSTISSGLNSFSMVIIEDFLVPYWEKISRSERLKIFFGKIIVGLLGGLLMLMAFVISLSKSNIVQLVYGFTGIINGPLIGIYILGFFVPFANSAGATIGMFVSYAFAIFMWVGGEFLKKNAYVWNIPPTSTENCTITTNTTYPTPTQSTEIATIQATEIIQENHSSLDDFFNINFNSYIFFSMMTSLLVGVIASLLTGPNKASEANPKLFLPILDNSCWPQKVRRFFRFGVPEISLDREDSDSVSHEDKL